MEENQKSNIPLLCRNGCGFYGSPNFDGLCSKCHRCTQVQQNPRESRLSVTDFRKSPEPVETVLKPDPLVLTPEKDSPVKNHNSSDTASTTTTITVTDSHDSSKITDRKFLPHIDGEVTEASLSACSTDDKPGISSNSPAIRKPRRCEMCRKPVGLASGYTCRCEGLFCSLHRYSDAHNCSFDYRKAGQDDIRRTNPQIVCPKLPKI